MVYKDFLENYVEVGDIVTYPVRFSSSMWMSIARIHHISSRKILAYVLTENWYTKKYGIKSVRLYRKDRQIKIVAPRNSDSKLIKKLLELTKDKFNV